MIEVTRLLGFAFAGADLLFEVDREGKVLFATGAVSAVTGDDAFVGRPASGLFAEAERARFNVIVKGLAKGDRVGPLPFTLASGAKVSLAMCYLPQNGNRISCTLVRPGKRNNLSGGTDTATGLSDKETFLAKIAAKTEEGGALALVNLPSLPGVFAKMSTAEADALMAHIGASVKSMRPEAAGRISDTSFGVVSSDPNAAKTLAQKIKTAIREKGVESLEVEEVLVSLKHRGLSPEQSMLAMRHVINKFTSSKLASAPADIGQAFDSMLGETLERAQAFNTTVSEGTFDLVFEAIVDLETNAPSHYEALTRFSPGQSPADTICFAEELGIADSLDLAVLLKVFALFEREQNSDVCVAVNVSGRTLSSASSFALLAGLLTKKRHYAPRILIEVTESSEITDLPAADKGLEGLRAMGYRVGIDDFGAGAASLQYLNGLGVDFVKMDGALIRRMGKSQREDSFLKGIVQTCRELGIETIAEWIDSAEKRQMCRDMGIDLGQGRYFGAAVGEFPKPMNLSAVRKIGVRA